MCPSILYATFLSCAVNNGFDLGYCGVPTEFTPIYDVYECANPDQDFVWKLMAVPNGDKFICEGAE